MAVISLLNPARSLLLFWLSLQIKSITLDKQPVTCHDLGLIDYKKAWDYQESLLQESVQRKAAIARDFQAAIPAGNHQFAVAAPATDTMLVPASNYLLLCEHPPVYTLGKSGRMENILISEAELQEQRIQFYKTNRGGDITFHGPGQVVGYPIIDLEQFYTDIGRYLRELEQVIILTLSAFGINGQRSKGETGVWIDPDVPGRERKICAMGVRCSRWVTMHGFALNVNTDLAYFNNIIPCGIEDKKVTSMHEELNGTVSPDLVKQKIKQNFEIVFKVPLRDEA
jgi:lipoyl(octanoyl) transferase